MVFEVDGMGDFMMLFAEWGEEIRIVGLAQRKAVRVMNVLG